MADHLAEEIAGLARAQTNRGKLARELADLFLTIQKTLKPQVSYEIGAFEASFSVKLKNCLQDVDAYAFEANPFNYKHWTSRRNFSDINYLHMAVSDSDGMLQFSLQDTVKETGEHVKKVRGNNSLMQRSDKTMTYKCVDVMGKRLDTFAAENNLQGKRACAWIDVEGAQKMVLMGARQVLSNDVVSVLIEVEEHSFWEDQWLAPEVLEYLSNLDFVCVARDFEYRKQHNVLLIKRKYLEIVADQIRMWHANIASN